MDKMPKEYINKSLGKVFKEYREKSKLTQEAVAEELGISTKYISRIENGTGGVKTESLVNYLNLLGIMPDVAFKDLITNNALKYKLQLSEKVEKLSDKEIQFLISFIDLMKTLNQNIL